MQFKYKEFIKAMLFVVSLFVFGFVFGHIWDKNKSSDHLYFYCVVDMDANIRDSGFTALTGRKYNKLTDYGYLMTHLKKKGGLGDRTSLTSFNYLGRVEK